jgi:hypothetical protein
MFNQAYSSLVAQLSEMPMFLSRTFASVPAALLLRTSTCDAMPLIERLWHVRDCDSDLYAFRIRRVLLEDRPTLQGVDVSVWPQERNYLARSGEQAVTEFCALRQQLIQELKPLGENSLARIGVRFDGSEINVLGLIEQLAEHDRDHRWRMASILQSFT